MNVHQWLWYVEQLLGQRHQTVRRQADGPRPWRRSAHRKSRREPGSSPSFFDTELHGDGVGSLEADTANIARQAIGVLRDDLDGVGTVGLENPYRPSQGRATRSVFWAPLLTTC